MLFVFDLIKLNTYFCIKKIRIKLLELKKKKNVLFYLCGYVQ